MNEIGQIMRDNNISVKELSQKSGYTVRDLYKLVKGEFTPSPDELKRIMDILTKGDNK